jgi:hypothetical protein
MFSVEKTFVRFEYVAIIPFQHVFSQNKDSALSACSTPLKQAQYLYLYIYTLFNKNVQQVFSTASCAIREVMWRGATLKSKPKTTTTIVQNTSTI